jgi:hypothetical protein
LRFVVFDKGQKSCHADGGGMLSMRSRREWFREEVCTIVLRFDPFDLYVLAALLVCEKELWVDVFSSICFHKSCDYLVNACLIIFINGCGVLN